MLPVGRGSGPVCGGEWVEEHRSQMGKDWEDPARVRKREIPAYLVLRVCLHAMEPLAEKSRNRESIWTPGGVSRWRNPAYSERLG